MFLNGARHKFCNICQHIFQLKYTLYPLSIRKLLLRVLYFFLHRRGIQNVMLFYEYILPDLCFILFFFFFLTFISLLYTVYLDSWLNSNFLKHCVSRQNCFVLIRCIDRSHFIYYGATKYYSMSLLTDIFYWLWYNHLLI